MLLCVYTYLACIPCYCSSRSLLHIHISHWCRRCLTPRSESRRQHRKICFISYTFLSFNINTVNIVFTYRVVSNCMCFFSKSEGFVDMCSAWKGSRNGILSFRRYFPRQWKHCRNVCRAALAIYFINGYKIISDCFIRRPYIFLEQRDGIKSSTWHSGLCCASPNILSAYFVKSQHNAIRRQAASKWCHLTQVVSQLRYLGNPNFKLYTIYKENYTYKNVLSSEYLYPYTT